ncbi:MAG: hypothetical protein JSV51_06150 [Candidatus Bathyarchaeota archaeon]|nr:MAG: hypothetical protein JSV51_06150 [Candidatus Bathyarchaeota archaeon]
MVEVEDAESIAINFVRKHKSVPDVNVTMTELESGVWVVRGTCPIDLGGHPWRESFEIKIDQKGRIKASSFKLI